MPNAEQFGIMLQGAWVTIGLFVLAAILGTLLALSFGIMGLSENRLWRAISRAYVEIARGASAIVLLFFVFYALPILLGIPQVLTPFVAAVIALGINMGGYGAEVVRAGIQSVPQGQTEASIALNLNKRDRLRHVVLPQALVLMIPPYGNLNIEVMKGTSLASLVTLGELTRETQTLRSQIPVMEDPPTTVALFTVALIMYFVMSQAIAFFYRWAENHLGGRWYGART